MTRLGHTGPDPRAYRPRTVHCILCDEAPAIDENDFCGHCRWVYRAQVEEGIFRLRMYLEKWAQFREWEREHAPAEHALTVHPAAATAAS